jgi:hypothetical protein
MANQTEGDTQGKTKKGQYVALRTSSASNTVRPFDAIRGGFPITRELQQYKNEEKNNLILFEYLLSFRTISGK